MRWRSQVVVHAVPALNALGVNVHVVVAIAGVGIVAGPPAAGGIVLPLAAVAANEHAEHLAGCWQDRGHVDVERSKILRHVGPDIGDDRPFGAIEARQIIEVELPRVDAAGIAAIEVEKQMLRRAGVALQRGHDP